MGADLILTESLRPDIATGWLALMICMILAATSTNRGIRLLGKLWKMLHRSVYAAALLVFAHWMLTAFDPQLACTVLLALCMVEALRWVPNRRKQAGSR